MELTKLVYASSHGGIEEDTLREIMQDSRTWNEQHDITGLLVVGEEDFFQVIEGPRSKVAACFMRIMQDSRHCGIHVLLAGPIANRSCPDWRLHEIPAPDLTSTMIDRYGVDGEFQPHRMSKDQIEGLIEELATAV
ncbi:BLUF domain-containing protein (plasmid) [Paracoccus liaowanqingii]|uniref:BLUF domain-containing protein n=1 Tax=Paracoccus liaowanqingii TaxID=2560053 RepID=A0A4Y5SU61_9RHOB|nr:BLUF domain-containing protein [Paracoccus liaowanqingii]QDA36315.1 BLUF domain-containing protein [Paracoccus liaowanqingii]